MTFTEYLAEKYNIDLEVEKTYFFAIIEQQVRLTKDEVSLAVDRMVMLSGYNKNQIMTKSKRGEVVLIRHVMTYLLHHNFNLSYREIGNIFGKQDHSTVIHAKDKISDLLEVGDKPTVDMYQRLKIVFDK